MELAGPFMVFAAIAAGTPGPANVLVTATGANVGVLRGIPCLLGVSLGTGLLLGAVALGLGSLVLSQPMLLTVMKFGGAGLLLWMSLQIAMAPPPSSDAEFKPVGFVGAAALQWINPKSWMVAVSAAGTYLSGDDTAAWVQAAWFTGLFTVVATPAVGVWLLFGAGMQRWLRTPRASRIFNVSMGALLAGSVILVFL